VALRATPTPAPSAGLVLDGGTWYRLDGVRLMPSDARLASASPIALEAPLNLTPSGNYAIGVAAWSGSAAAGAPGAAGTTCGGWSSSTGSALLGDVTDSAPAWFGGSDGGCGSPQQVYCFEK
jgi:hypothetical protein